MKKIGFLIYALPVLLIALSSCRSPVIGEAEKAGISINISIPGEPESNVPEGVLRALGKSMASTGSRLIHPSARRIVGTITADGASYSTEAIIEADTKTAQLNFKDLPINRNIEISIKVLDNEAALVGQASKSISLLGSGANTISLAIKPVGAIKPEVSSSQDVPGLFDLYYSDLSPANDVLILEVPVQEGKGIYFLGFPIYGIDNCKIYGLYNADGKEHRGAINYAGVNIDALPDFADGLFFGHTGGNQGLFYLVLTEVEFLQDTQDLTIYGGKLNADMLVVWYEGYNSTDRKVLEYNYTQSNNLTPPLIDFGTVNSTNSSYTMQFELFNPYQEGISISAVLDAGSSEDYEYSCDKLPTSPTPILPKKSWKFDIIFEKLSAEGVSPATGSLTINQGSNEEFKLLFTGEVNS